jgi:tetratricopeptide (TPR) repeat protein
MKTKGALTGIIILLVIAGGIGGLWIYQRNKGRNDLAARIADLSPRGGGAPSGIEDLRAAIAAYEEQIERHVKDAAQTGVYWKILASRLQDRKLHIEALEALEQALRYYPEDPALHYMTGVSAGYAAKDTHEFPGGESGLREEYYALSESAYLRAIELDERYLRPRFGLGVLYVFELGRPGEAIPHLRRYLDISTRDVDAMFLLARAYYDTERWDEALELYDRIIKLTRDADKRREAENNRQIILGLRYG